MKPVIGTIGQIGHVGYTSSVEDESFEVNGVRYKKQPKHAPPALFAPLFPTSVNTYSDKWDGKDIIEEYQLIQAKQSKPPRAKREWVVSKFHKHFQEVDFVKHLGQPLQA